MLESIGLPDILIILCIVAVLLVVAILPYWFIFSKAGYSGWVSLTQLIPLVNVVALYYLAFAEWPIQREVRDLKGHV
jgi:hypothetical protein